MRILILIFFCSNLFANQSLQVSSGVLGTVSVTTLQGDQHWQGRIHGFSVPTGGSVQFASFPGFAIALDNGSGNCGAGYQLRFTDNVDSFGALNNYLCVAVPSGSSDFMFDVQRCVHSDTTCTWIAGINPAVSPNAGNPAAGMLLGEAWNIDTTGLQQSISPIAVVNPISGTFVSIGAGTSMGSLAYLRWCSGVTQMNTNVSSRIPPGPNGNTPQSTCNVASTENWEFEGDGSGGQGRYNLHFSPAATFGTTPAPAPGCTLQPTSFSTAFVVQLSSAPCLSYQDNPALTYSWSYLGTGADGITQSPAFSSTTAANPTVTGLVRGSFNVQLIITDSANQSRTVTVHDGVVVTDANHNVQSTGNAVLDKLYMPMVQWGYNPYPYFDDRAKQLADYFGSLQSGIALDTWNTAGTGTVSCTQGSTTCTTSTNLRSVTCPGGGTFATAGQCYLIVWNSAGTYRTPYQVTASTPTTLTISPAYRDPSETNMNYSVMGINCGVQGCDAVWLGASGNINYYDNAVAFYALYFRSGIDTYYTYATTMAQRWWGMPLGFNKGHSCDLGGGYPCIVSVSARDATLGVVTAYLMGSIPGFLQATERYWQASDEYSICTQGGTPACSGSLAFPVFDLRVISMRLARVAYWAMLETGTNRTNALNALANSITGYWNVHQQANGGFVSPTFGYGPVSGNGNDPGSTVTLTNGSTAVTGAGGTHLTVAGFPGNYFVAASRTSPMTCTSADGFDTVAYYNATVNSDTSVTLGSPYNGNLAGSGRGWEVSNLVGCGIEPFFAGFNIHAMYYVYQALLGNDAVNAARVKNIILNEASWIENFGFMGASQPPAPGGINVNGLFYARQYVQSEPNPWADFNNWNPPGAGGCSGNQIDNNIQQQRFLGAEIMAGMAYARLLGDNSTIPSTLYGALYGGLGGANSDHSYVWSYLGSPQSGTCADYTIGTQKAKDNGFAFGWGNGAIWPAAAAAPSAAPRPGTVLSGAIVSGAVIQ